MASRNDRKSAKPARKSSKAPATARSRKLAVKAAKKPAPRLAGKPAKAAVRKPAAKPKAAARRGGDPALVEVGVTEVLGVRYRVFTTPPQRLVRALRFDARDKVDLDVRLSDTVEWQAPAKQAFRIQFAGPAPDLGKAAQRSFTSKLEGGKQRVAVTLLGHPPGTRLDYDIYAPPDADQPMDPSLIIYPSAELSLKLA